MDSQRKDGWKNVLLQNSAIAFFEALIEGRAADDFLFIRSDGRRWKKSSQTRPFKEALLAADLPEKGSIYALRHTYISSP